MMLVRLLVETPGRKDGTEHIYQVGEVISLSNDLALLWLADGRAVEADTPSPDPALDLEGMTVSELRDLAKEKGVSYSGLKKAELIDELEAAYAFG